MNLRLTCGLGLSLAAGLLTGVGLAFVAGRGGAVSFLGAQLGGISLGGLGAVAAAWFCGFRSARRALAIALALVFLISFVAEGLLARSFAAGFERTALDTATVSEWKALSSLGEDLLTSDSTGRSSLLPDFVRRVYPHRRPYAAVSAGDSKNGENLCVSVWWRDSGICVGMDIGDNLPPRSRCLYQTLVTPGVRLTVFRDG